MPFGFFIGAPICRKNFTGANYLQVDLADLGRYIIWCDDRVVFSAALDIDPKSLATAADTTVGTLEPKVVVVVLKDKQARPLVVLLGRELDSRFYLKISGDGLDIAGSGQIFTVQIFAVGDPDSQNPGFNVVRCRLVSLIRVDPLPTDRPFF